MKDPEQVRRIELLAKAETALQFTRVALTQASTDLSMVVPADHPIREALANAREGLAKADVLTTQLLNRFKR